VHVNPTGLTRVTLAVILLSAAATASAQEAELRAQKGPYYAGEPVAVQVVATGFDANDPPTCQLQGEPPAGITLQGPRMSQSSSSFTQIINGRVTTRESVEYRFTFVVTADREGEFAIGPFQVRSGSASAEVGQAAFTFAQLENDPDMQIEFSLPQQSVYVGQELPLTIRWSFVGETPAIQYAFQNLRIRSSLFDQISYKAAPVQSRTVLTIVTGKGELEVDADAEIETNPDGRRQAVVTGTVTLVPDTAGSFPDIPVTCRTSRVAQWSRSLFGDLTPRAEAPAMAAGKPLRLEVKPIPLAGRPASYCGAVGSDFTMDVSANRTVVRVGDPISLTLSIRGRGNLEKVSLPPLAENAGMSSDLFQTPNEQVAGTFDGDVKQFKVNVRVKDQRVTEIPAVAFAWFDPIAEQFQTTQSKPIPLEVMEAQVVSAANVVAAAPASGSASAGGDAAASGPGGGSGSAGGITFVGANLAIEQDLTRLVSNAGAGASPEWIAAVLYALAAVVLVGGAVARRRAQIDTTRVQRKKRLKALRTQIAAAERLPGNEGLATMVQSLHELVAHFELRRRAEADALIAQCEDIIYATRPGEGHPPHVLTERALALVDEAIENS